MISDEYFYHLEAILSLFTKHTVTLASILGWVTTDQTFHLLSVILPSRNTIIWWTFVCVSSLTYLFINLLAVRTQQPCFQCSRTLGYLELNVPRDPQVPSSMTFRH